MSVRFELWFLAGNFLVSACGRHVVAESADPGLHNHKFAASEFERDPAFLFGTFGFEDGSIAFNRRDAAAFACIGGWALRRFVFVNARKFHLKTLMPQCPDFEFTVFGFPGAVHLSSCDTRVATGLHRNTCDGGKAERTDKHNLHLFLRCCHKRSRYTETFQESKKTPT